MSLLRKSLLLLPLLTLACEGPAGTDGTNGVDGTTGTDGTNGTNGTDGTNGADGSAIATDTLAPGEYLSLEHGLGEGDKFYQAQFSWNGVVYDHSDYPTVRPGHANDGAWFGSDELVSYYDDLGAAVLDSGELVVLQQGEDALDDNLFILTIRDMDGNVISTIDSFYSSYDGSTGYFEYWDPSLVALGDGGFALVFQAYVYDDATDMELYGTFISRYDAAFTFQGTTEFGSLGANKGFDDHNAAGTSDGGIAVLMSGWDDSTDNGYFTTAVTYSGAGVVSSFPVANTSGEYGRIAPLDDGRIAMLVGGYLDGEASIEFLIAGPDGTLDTEIVLQNSYLTRDSALVLGSQGTLLVAAESGGPDLPFFAVFGTDGSVIQPLTGMSGWENDAIEAAAFPDGDFLVMVTEDDSTAPMTWVVGAQGGLLRPMVIGDLAVVPDSSPGVFFPADGNNIARLAPSYNWDQAPYRSTYTKGMLQVRVESDDEVRLYNETPDSLDVTMIVHRTP